MRCVERIFFVKPVPVSVICRGSLSCFHIQRNSLAALIGAFADLSSSHPSPSLVPHLLRTLFLRHLQPHSVSKPEVQIPNHKPEALKCLSSSQAELTPQRIAEDTMAFMFESSLSMKTTPWAETAALKDADYHRCWAPLRKHFRP